MSKAPKGYRIRAVVPKDEGRWYEMFAALVATGPEPCTAEAPAYVWRSVTDSGGQMKLLIAADSNDRAIAFLLYLTHPYSWTCRPITYLLDLFVEPEARGAGIGTALIEFLADIGRNEGWLKIYWMTQADNERAHALYGKLAQRSSLVRYDMILNSH